MPHYRLVTAFFFQGYHTRFSGSKNRTSIKSLNESAIVRKDQSACFFAFQNTATCQIPRNSHGDRALTNGWLRGGVIPPSAGVSYPGFSDE